MPISMYQASVPVFQKMLKNLDGILDKAAASAEARKFDPAVLLNARLALLSRQFDTAGSDLREAQAALSRYFERDHRRVQLALETVRQVATQARSVAVPRPDATLAAIATANAAAVGR